MCLPIHTIGLNDPLPSNSFGYWVPFGQALGGFSSYQLAWNSLLQNVTEVGFVLNNMANNVNIERLLLDNICLSCTTERPTNDGAYCCKGENLVQNGNFEFGNIVFTSDYSINTTISANATVPGMYSVVNTSQAATISPLWQVQDHTKCVDPSAPNSLFMLVNGKTQQSPGTSSVIYENSSVTADLSKEYKVCLNLKNLPQCTFDILPVIKVELIGANWSSTSGYNGGWITINTSSNPCDWFLLEGCITPIDKKVTLKIHLMEDGNGDGNDLALDDIAIQEKMDRNITLSVLNQSGQLTGSANTIVPNDDPIFNDNICTDLNNGNQYYWIVAEADLTSPTLIDFSTMAWSSNQGGYNFATGTNINPGWNLTTAFPGYTFQNNIIYYVGLYVPSCCENCYDEEWLYQLTLNSGRLIEQSFVFTDDIKDQVKKHFTFDAEKKFNNLDKESKIIIHPNPFNSQFIIELEKEETGYFDVYDLLGKKIHSDTFKNQKEIMVNLKNVSYGVYKILIKTDSETFQKSIQKN